MKKQIDMEDVKNKIKRMIDINELFLDSLKHHQSNECADRYQFVAKEIDSFLCNLVDCLNIELY